jgi:hypothetical protein
MKVPHSINHASNASIISALYRRHDYEATRYREAAKNVADEGQADFFRSLAHYRHELREGLRQAMQDISETVNTPSKESVSTIQEAEADWNQALTDNNIEQLASMVFTAEQATSDYYREILDGSELLDTVRTLVEKQHETILEWNRKVERFKTVPQQRNNDFK